MNSNKKQIQYVDGLCGSGKSHNVIQYIKKNKIMAPKVILAVPSIILANQFYKDMQSVGISNVFIINSETVPVVSGAIIEKIKEINQLEFGVIIITQQAFPNIPYFQDKHQWTLIVDEIPSIDSFYAPSLPYNKTKLADFIEIEEQITPNLYRMKLVDEKVAADFLKRNHDDIDVVVKPIIKDMVNHHELFVDKENWDNLVLNNHITDDSEFDYQYGNQANKLFCLSMLKPEIFFGFRRVIMMGANFTQSLLHKYWSEYKGIQFSVFDHVQNGLRYSTHNNGKRLVIKYLQEAKWSKCQRNKQENGISKADYYDNLVNEFFKGKPMPLYVTNNDRIESAIKGVKIPVIAHGLNKYDTYTGIYFSPALNRTPKHTSMLNDLGIDSVYLDRAQSHEIAYQSIMRTAIRNPLSNAIVEVVVSDQSTAESIARLFPGCSIGLINGGVRKVIGLSSSERRSKSKLKKLEEILYINQYYSKSDTNYLNIASCNTLNTNLSTDCVDVSGAVSEPNISLSLTSNLYDPAPQNFEVSRSDFIKTLKGVYTNNIITVKKSQGLFNGSTYDEETSRKCLQDIKYSSFVLVDIDDGDLSPEEFSRIFGKDYKHSHILMNSFSRKEETPNRYRALFFITEKVTDEVYRDIHAYIRNIVKKYGYLSPHSDADRVKILEKNPNAKFSGLDMGKTHTASYFFLPCQVKGREEWSFFKKILMTNAAETDRYSINPAKIVQYSTNTVRHDY